MSRKGNCWDSAPMESWFNSLKNERVFHRRYQTRGEVQADLFDYIEVFLQPGSQQMSAPERKSYVQAWRFFQGASEIWSARRPRATSAIGRFCTTRALSTRLAIVQFQSLFWQHANL
jgi:hypothetical protein